MTQIDNFYYMDDGFFTVTLCVTKPIVDIVSEVIRVNVLEMKARLIIQILSSRDCMFMNRR